MANDVERKRNNTRGTDPLSFRVTHLCVACCTSYCMTCLAGAKRNVVASPSINELFSDSVQKQQIYCVPRHTKASRPNHDITKKHNS